MSDTTPRPDETPGDPTAPRSPRTSVTTADAGRRRMPATAEQPLARGPAPPQPAARPALPSPQYAQPGYAQPQPPPPAYAAAPGTAVAGPNPMSPTDERTWGMVAHAGHAGRHGPVRRHARLHCALVIYLVHKDRGPFVRTTPRTRSTCRSSAASW